LQLKAAILLKNKFRKNYQTELSRAFTSGQSLILEHLLVHREWVLQPKKVSDHFSILIGCILKCNICQYLTDNEDMAEEQQFGVINQQILTVLHAILADGLNDLRVLRHIKIVIENVGSVDFSGVFLAKDFSQILHQLT
jgi:hypothetical protein